MRWSSEPEARSRPEVDQLYGVSSRMITEWARVPQGVHASVVPFELVHDVQIINPLPVTVYASNVRIFSALLPNLPPEQAIVDCVLHLHRLAAAGGAGVLVTESPNVAARRTRPAPLGIASGKTRLSQAGLFYKCAGDKRRSGHACRRSCGGEGFGSEARPFGCL
jgi:hypothetical protein